MPVATNHTSSSLCARTTGIFRDCSEDALIVRLPQRSGKRDRILIIDRDPRPRNPRSFSNLGTIFSWCSSLGINECDDFPDTHSFHKFWVYNKNCGVRLRIYAHEELLRSCGNVKATPRNSYTEVGYIFAIGRDIVREFGEVSTGHHILQLLASAPSQAMIGLARDVLEYEIQCLDSYLSGLVFRVALVEDESVVFSDGGYYGIDFDRNGLLAKLSHDDAKFVAKSVLPSLRRKIVSALPYPLLVAHPSIC